MTSRRSLLITASVGIVTLVGISVVGALGAGGPRRKAAKQPNAAIQAIPKLSFEVRLKPAEYDPFIIHPPKKGNPKELEVLRQLASSISQVRAVPDVRRQHFAWVANENVCLHGYHGLLLNASPTATGFVVTIRVSPNITTGNQPGGRNLTSTDFIEERWEFSGGAWYFRGADENVGGGPGWFMG